MQAPVVISHFPLVPSDLLHLLLGFCLILEALQTPIALHLGLVTQTLAVPAGLNPHWVPPSAKTHWLLQHGPPSHCSLGSWTPLPQLDVAVLDPVPVLDLVAV